MDDDVKNDLDDKEIDLEQENEVIETHEQEEVVQDNQLDLKTDPENGEADLINDEVEAVADEQQIEHQIEQKIDQGIDEPDEAQVLDVEEVNKEDESQNNPDTEQEVIIKDTEEYDNPTTIADNEDDFNNEAVEIDSGHDTNEIYSQSGTANSRLMSADSIRHDLDQNDEFYNDIENDDETDNLNHLDRDTSSFDTVIHPMSADKSVNVNHIVHSPLIDDDNDVVLENVVNSIENGDDLVSMTERNSSAVIEVL